MSKFKVGDRVFLFNSISMKVESDQVFAIIYAPIPVEGKEQNSAKDVSKRIAEGEMKVHEQCQTLQHQILDVDVLFRSDAECREHYRKFFAEE